MQKIWRLCPYCLEPVTMSYDIDVCKGCETTVEGSTVKLTDEQYEQFCETGQLPNEIQEQLK